MNTKKTLFILPNLGNTCYLNTGIQCLMNHPSFRIFINVNLHNFPDNSIIQHFAKFSTLLNENRSLTDKDHWDTFNTLVKYISNAFKHKMNIYDQNDLCEFITFLFDKLNSEISRKLNRSHHINVIEQMNSNETILDRLKTKCDIAWISNFCNEYSTIVPMIYSLLITQIHCGCGKKHHNFEFHNIIQLEIPQHLISSTYPISLNECFEEFLKPLKLNQKNNTDELVEWTCDKCKENVYSEKSFVFWKLPEVLLISLKRFVFDSNGNLKKLTMPIQIPETIDIPKLINPNCSSSYELISVGCHQGTLDYGHYYSIIKHNEEWYEIDDDIVRPFNTSRKFKDAYLLVYKEL